MEFARAVEAARTANLQFFTQLSPKELAKVMSQRDEDERTLLHTACGTPSLQLVDFLVTHGARAQVNAADEEVRRDGGGREQGGSCMWQPKRRR